MGREKIECEDADSLRIGLISLPLPSLLKDSYDPNEIDRCVERIIEHPDTVFPCYVRHA